MRRSKEEEEEGSAFERRIVQAIDDQQRSLNSTSSNVQSPNDEELTDDKMYDERFLIVITTIFFICLLVIYWEDYTDKWIIIPTYSLNILVLLFKRDSYGLDNFLYTIIAVLNTVIVILLFLFLSQTSQYFSESFNLNSPFLRLRIVLYVLYTLLVNIRIAKRANRIATISKKLLERKKSAIDHGNVVQRVQVDEESDIFVKDHLTNRVENYSGDSLYLFLIAIISFFSYQVIPLQRGESYTGHFVSVMLLVSTELVILAIYDLTIRNGELDAIEMRNDSNFANKSLPARFCGLPVHWFRLLRTVKMQPLSLLLLFFGTLTIIFFALD